ncbi:Eco57I restriction-modification methylase domain-containing protein [Bacillota bacterium]
MEKTREDKSKLGQFMTPGSIAKFMAQLFTFDTHEDIKLLDAGSGKGALTDAVIDLVAATCPRKNLSITQFEIDESLTSYLRAKYENYSELKYDLQVSDFVEQAAEWISKSESPYTHAIQNPPYRKINTNSRYREQLRLAGIETVNLYSGFVALALLLLRKGGELVVIIPRSFCNGPYYKPFRKLIFGAVSIDRIHLFDSRNKPFKDEDVLQESMIIKFTKTQQRQFVTVSNSTDDTFSDIDVRQYDFSDIVKPDDPEMFIHIPNGKHHQTIMDYEKELVSLSELGVTISTGPVVDFRMKEYLSPMPETGAVPLIYPGHFNNRELHWPKKNFKKPNAIQRNSNTRKWLYPAKGTFVVVNRFSAKEEKRRVVANIIETDYFDCDQIGIENHLNVFHISKTGLSRTFAYGLAMYLNSKLVDNYVRVFNGHTQINATDLRSLKYPRIEALEQLGEFYLKSRSISDDEVDRKVVEILENRKTYRRGA